MKSDLDILMAERNLDALLIIGAAYANPTMYYLVNGAKVGKQTVVIKRRGEPAVIVANSMEREEAAASGLRVLDRNMFHAAKLLKEENGNWLRADARLFAAMLDAVGATGRIAVYGRVEHGSAFALWQELMSLRPDLQIIGEYNNSIFDKAWYTKDPNEIARIGAVGKKTVEIVEKTWNLLASHRAQDGVLIKKNGSPLTVGDVKATIRGWLQERNLETPEDFIFAIGRDAGVPHSHGNEADPIALGKSIVFDIYPCEAGGGYYFDFTRTWCVGYAPPEVEKAYDEVMEIFNVLSDSLQVGASTSNYQRLTNDFFEARDHATTRSNPQTTNGYVHSLGHGIGLNIHESPFFRDAPNHPDTLQPGIAITIEPGLYYPERGFGVRIEDSVWLNPKTQTFETIADFKKDLVIPVKTASRKKAAASGKRKTAGRGAAKKSK